MMELVTLKGKYRVGEAVELCLRVEDETADTAEITVWHLARALYCQSVAVRGKETIFALPPFDMPGACYGVEARMIRNGMETGCAATAVNIAGDVVRYGFLSDFLPEGDEDVAALAKYHIDHVQFYDWSYRHDSLVPPTEEYTDMMVKT